MTPREKEIKDLTNMIKELKAKLKQVKKSNNNDLFLNKRLRTFPDFPNVKSGYTLWSFIEDRLKIYTVNDLIHTNPNDLIRFRGFGKGRMKELEDWMDKHNLMFML